MFPGETPVQSGQRLLSRELGLEIESDRFRPVCTQAFAFDKREQEPKEHGTADAQICFCVRLKDEQEVKKVVLDEKEYSDSEWKSPSEILEGNYHPALKYAVGCMLAREAMERLQKCEAEGGGDEELAKLARVFIKRTKEVDHVLKKNDYTLVSNELNYEATVKTKF